MCSGYPISSRPTSRSSIRPASAAKILPNIGALQGRQALRGDPQRVAQRQPDAPFAQVERQDAPII